MFFLRSALLIILLTTSRPALPQETCDANDRLCVLSLLEESIKDISEQSWRDRAYREYAKTLAFDGRTDDAIAIITKIKNPDTKAMTIRGIGMAMAENSSPPEIYKPVFKLLLTEAEKIDHPPSYAIALTYISMAQAFAGDDAEALKTARSMENKALRNKAFAENAEIQAERGAYEKAMESVGYIESSSFRNKAYKNVAGIFAKSAKYSSALNTALKIDNPTIRADTIQFILDRQKPREAERYGDQD
jgi:hypothetical protein